MIVRSLMNQIIKDTVEELVFQYSFKNSGTGVNNIPTQRMVTIPANTHFGDVEQIDVTIEDIVDNVTRSFTTTIVKSSRKIFDIISSVKIYEQRMFWVKSTIWKELMKYGHTYKFTLKLAHGSVKILKPLQKIRVINNKVIGFQSISHKRQFKRLNKNKQHQIYEGFVFNIPSPVLKHIKIEDRQKLYFYIKKNVDENLSAEIEDAIMYYASYSDFNKELDKIIANYIILQSGVFSKLHYQNLKIITDKFKRTVVSNYKQTLDKMCKKVLDDFDKKVDEIKQHKPQKIANERIGIYNQYDQEELLKYVKQEKLNLEWCNKVVKDTYTWVLFREAIELLKQYYPDIPLIAKNDFIKKYIAQWYVASEANLY